MGDDIPDIPILKKVGLACCPQDAIPEVKNICSYCKTFKLPFHNTHSYCNCPHNKTNVYYPEYMNRFS